MTDLEHDLIQLCKRLKHGSYSTQAGRRQMLLLAARQLEEGGFRRMKATSLSSKHIDHLLARWQQERLSPGTLKNRLAALRWWTQAVGRAGIIPAANSGLGLPRRHYINRMNKAKTLAPYLDKITDPYLKVSLRLQEAFGLRREEALKFRPAIADKGTVVYLQGSWTKGNRERVIPILTAEQVAVLDDARALAGEGSLIPPHKRYIEQRRLYDGQCLAAGLENGHGLRHGYAQRRYEELTGWKCPMAGGPNPRTLCQADRILDQAARTVIAEELGHSRESITATYLGS
ncbi:MAG: integrase domain-containing protein [Azoarcus sp.]|jgi:integrase|nr:integrase domain-containing protein [Azoarcus sp.]